MPTINGLQFDKTKNDLEAENTMKTSRYQPSEKEISISNQNKHDLSLVSPRVKVFSKITLATEVTKGDTHTVTPSNATESGAFFSRR